MFEKIDKIDQEYSIKLRLPQEKKFLRAVAAFFAHSGDSWFWLAGLFIIWLIAKDDWHAITAFLEIGRAHV